MIEANAPNPVETFVNFFRFFSIEELSDLCLTLGIDFEEIERRRDGKRATVQALVLYAYRNARLDELYSLTVYLRESQSGLLPKLEDLRATLDATLSHSQEGNRDSSPIPWSLVQSECERSSQWHLGFMRPKYRKDLYVPRRALQQHVETFLSSHGSDYLVLNGRSGMGKSGFLYHLARQLHHGDLGNHACLAFDCGQLVEGSTEIDASLLLANLGRGDLPESVPANLSQYLDRIEASLDDDDGKLVVILDGINESENLHVIIGFLTTLQYRKPRPWIKTIFSCRPHVWETVFEEFNRRIPIERLYEPGAGCTPYVEVPRFTNEEAAEAYRKYRSVYRFTPHLYTDLPPRIQVRLQDPLLLSLVAEVYEGKEIEPHLTGSDLRLIPDYAQTALGKHASLTADVPPTLGFLKDILPSLMASEIRIGAATSTFCGNYASLEEVPEAFLPELNRSVRAGILEVDPNGRRIKFRFERFYDYYFGMHLRKLAADGIVVRCGSDKHQN